MRSSLYLSLPEKPGVYLFKNALGEVIYIGKAINLKKRVSSYFHPLSQIAQNASKIDYIRVNSEFEALLLEAELVKKWQPRFNIKLKDGKSFLYIVFTREEFPKVLTVRKNEYQDALYRFGPFPSSQTVRRVLKFLRRIFPYCSQKGNRSSCFFSHINLCQPCPGTIVRLKDEERKKLKVKYLWQIRKLSKVLLGKTREVLKSLEKEMRIASQSQDFEKAALLRDQINDLNYLTSPRFSMAAYLEKSNFLEEEQQKELGYLKNYLSVLFKQKINLARLECYDISNLSGQKATGSMVVFTNGVEDKNEYRRFRIKISGKPDDTAMITEVLERRFKHPDWDFPDLIVVDGGKSQVSVALEVLKKLGLTIPVIGLSKREEEIVSQLENGKWKLETLPEGSPALNLLKRIRDEAHRFAKTYHLLLRNVLR